MTAKERLQEWLDALDESDAEEALSMIELDTPLRDALTPDEIREVELSRAAVRDGRVYSTDEVLEYVRSRRR